MKSKTYVIGDIHGAYKALKQVMEKVEIKKGDQLIFLGDYVDGWPESYQVIDYLIHLSKQYSCTFIRGNHDIWCASWLAGEEADQAWLENKGVSTIKSYDGVSQAEKNIHLNFFNNLKDYYLDQENRLFIHAGFTAMKGVTEEPFTYNFNNDRTLLEMAFAMDPTMSPESVFYPKRLKLYKEIYIGHTPTTKYEITVPINVMNLYDMDTGLSQGGRISLMDINSKEFWQSDSIEDFYSEF